MKLLLNMHIFFSRSDTMYIELKDINSKELNNNIYINEIILNVISFKKKMGWNIEKFLYFWTCIFPSYWSFCFTYEYVHVISISLDGTLIDCHHFKSNSAIGQGIMTFVPYRKINGPQTYQRNRKQHLSKQAPPKNPWGEIKICF